MEARPQASFPAAKAASIPQDFEAPFDAPPVEELFSRPIATEAKPAGATPLVLTALSPVPTTQRFPFNPEESLPVGSPASPAELDSHRSPRQSPDFEEMLPARTAGLPGSVAIDNFSSQPQSSSCDPQSAIANRQSAMDIIPLGQIDNSFIVAADRGALLIIDQHVAHERVLFEKVLQQRGQGKVESQRLLLPIIVELPPRQQVILESITPELSACGFEVEPFGRKTIAIKAAPADLRTDEIQKLLSELLEGLEKETQALSLTRLREKIAASIACHAAIKVNMHLEHSKMVWLIDALLKTQYPMSCPHGRPIILRYEKNEILKAFKRI